MTLGEGSKFQLPSSFGLGGKVISRSGGKGSLTRLINQLISDNPVYRTAPATPGLLIIGHVILFFASICFWSNKITIFCLSFHDYRCLNLDPQNMECLKVFNNFVYVFWRAEGFGCMWATEIKGMLMYAKVL